MMVNKQGTKGPEKQLMIYRQKKPISAIAESYDAFGQWFEAQESVQASDLVQRETENGSFKYWKINNLKLTRK